MRAAHGCGAVITSYSIHYTKLYESDAPDLGIPKVAIIAPPRDGGTIASRYFVSSNCHPVFAATGAMALAVV